MPAARNCSAYTEPPNDENTFDMATATRQGSKNACVPVPSNMMMTTEIDAPRNVPANAAVAPTIAYACGFKLISPSEANECLMTNDAARPEIAPHKIVGMNNPAGTYKFAAAHSPNNVVTKQYTSALRENAPSGAPKIHVRTPL